MRLHTEHLYDMLSRGEVCVSSYGALVWYAEQRGGVCLHTEHLYGMLSRGEVCVSSYGALV